MSQSLPEMNPYTPVPQPSLPSWPRLGLAGIFGGLFVGIMEIRVSLERLWLYSTGLSGYEPYFTIIIGSVVGLVAGFLGGTIVSMFAKTINGQLASRVNSTWYFIGAAIGGAILVWIALYFIRGIGFVLFL